ncbi:MAG: hypothetical protein A3C85_02940 [Candidatus Doudnabacteria bacterium RIFCSPHIGHO2_02_FULL_48_21]|uniref:Vitamin K epoxide reductase domain-containing protein n=1 Tax=Candidatus Doudnabacteria bacterium RIFCSPLOWO2_02_FULL_48_13 TaxID=1817845 RepID=A0A1F5QCU5_9BACT|nr:MAG: hypothetical protein A3K05_00200 [Candidatus Doudnabacteria bacterium RIFCSPHIGHO2_01_48_18]OGE79462.1 MAG: hypothetical protein A2668_02105 [Candidatus Doudnabacteria bacterium RIFCSPHIGHO2_01_FULL_48_180]OGE91605.1 MAG: hypothetical protein A3F44_02770 [Candidatus Doudnabacteria bacterium RIFCSPHIGHO2_12_FULL_47_25]OGE93220.1 MAG: hypothetical protein A3C85_02940 [Candidatus Doudnabacteria bacterium RIFCSPHIGHO2_02_FULL_48_21]OGE97909.1 MAG: hypothetical protein A3A83_03090 [Candidatu
MTSKQRTIYRFLITSAALLGLVIMSYLTYIHYANTSSFCDISKEVSCDVVTTSLYSEVFGLPVSVLGLGYFLMVLVISLRKMSPDKFRFLFMATAFALVPSLYLSYMEYFVIKSFCILCETSKILMFIILGVSYAAIRDRLQSLGRLLAPIIIGGLVISGITFFIQNGRVISEDYTDFVEHLNRRGWVYYKSYTCSNCKRQEKLLGEAYKGLNAVECHPKGPNGNPQLCLQKNITKTPTWLLEENGKVTVRLEGLQPIEELMKISGYENNKN